MEIMLTPFAWIALLFDETGRSPADELADQEQIDDVDPGRVLCCARCKTRITTHAARVSVAGAHRHSFTNPGGFPFHIGCFSRVWNCAPVGGVTMDDTWFAGYAWQILSCGFCGEHMGWSYSSSSERFYGLILARLVEGSEAEG